MKRKKSVRYILSIVILFVGCCAIVAILFSNELNKAVRVQIPNTPTPTILPTPTQDRIQTYLDEYGGDPEVYQRILSLTDCDELQREYNSAHTNHLFDNYYYLLGYMDAALDRRWELKCFK